MTNDLIVDPVIHNLPVAIIVVNKHRRVMLSNKAAQTIAEKSEEQIFGLHGGEAIGCIFSDDHPDGCGFAEACEACEMRDAVLDSFATKTDKETFDTQLTLKKYGSRDLKVSVTYLNLEEIKKEFIATERRMNPGRRKDDVDKEMVIVSMEDITEFKKKERLEAAMETVGALCHEMNQPLQVLEGSLSLINLDMGNCNGNAQKIRDNLEKAYEAQERLAKIVVNLKELKEYQTKQYLRKRILDIEKSSKGDLNGEERRRSE